MNLYCSHSCDLICCNCYLYSASIFCLFRIALNDEYSFLITTTPAVCSNRNNFQNTLGAQLDYINNFLVTLNVRQVIQTANIIAARPNDDTHAERWVLHNNINAIRQRTQNSNTCVLFFTYFTPCLARCASPDTEQSIINTFQTNQLFNNINANLKAFVFYTIYQPDMGRLPELRTSLMTFEQYMPVFRCSSWTDSHGRETNRCYMCRTEMTDCLWVGSIG